MFSGGMLWVVFASVSSAASSEGLCMAHPTLNTSSTSSSGCSGDNRFGKYFKKCRNVEGHVKASVLLLGLKIPDC